jgi:glycosyltransferase involved in cell wall biosynthesis
MKDLKKDIKVIYHGCDTATFKPIDKEVRDLWRGKYLGITDPETFVFVNVNRNSVRKDIPRSILAFKEFKKQVPNSLYYIHTAAKDNNIDLLQCVDSLGLSLSKDVVFPARFNLADGGFPDDILNQFYNCGDAFLTTTLGEGWGLTITEAMCAGVPVIGPNNTSIPEILGGDLDRGYVYDCAETTWVDNSGYRPLGRMEDIVAKMLEAHENRGTDIERGIVHRASKFADTHVWSAVCKDWIKVFDEVAKMEDKNQGSISTEVV